MVRLQTGVWTWRLRSVCRISRPLRPGSMRSKGTRSKLSAFARKSHPRRSVPRRLRSARPSGLMPAPEPACARLQRRGCVARVNLSRARFLVFLRNAGLSCPFAFQPMPKARRDRRTAARCPSCGNRTVRRETTVSGKTMATMLCCTSCHASGPSAGEVRPKVCGARRRDVPRNTPRRTGPRQKM